MGRLVDADELKRNLLKWMPKDQSDYMDSAIPPLENLTVSMVMEIDDAPTVDAVEVVRCKDCMHYGFTDNRIPEEQVWWCYFWDDVKSPDAYCSDGEREDGDNGTD